MKQYLFAKDLFEDGKIQVFDATTGQYLATVKEGEEIDFAKDQEPEKAPEPAPEQNNNTQLSMF